MKPRNVIVQKDLTSYAYGLGQELEPMRSLAQLLAPIVPTGGTTGKYNTFDDTQSFKAYADAVARRAMGGQAGEIGFLNDSDTYNAEPYGLRIPIDNHEIAQTGDDPAAQTLLREGKTRTLIVQCMLSYLVNVVSLVKTAVTKTAGAGAWNEANVDPIKELNDAITAVWRATGVLPNRVVMDFGAWSVLAGNPLILKRMPGADLAMVTPKRIQSLLVNPGATIDVVETSVLYGGGFGNTGASKRGITGGSALIFFNSSVATQYDPSFCKTFAPSRNLFTEVYSYREEPHVEWIENDWTCDVEIVSSSLCKRIDVEGANG
jgi:hypothetical protein